MNFLLPLRANRRQLLLTGSACTIASALAAGSAIAGEAGIARLAESGSVILHDPRFPLAADMQRRLLSNGARIIELAQDPVRMWRGEFSAVLQRRETRLLGATRWPDFLMIRGLAAETRRHVHYQRVDARTGAIVWLIA